jgi:hypothetical protein
MYYAFLSSGDYGVAVAEFSAAGYFRDETAAPRPGALSGSGRRYSAYRDQDLFGKVK